HSELPSERIMREGGRLHGFQIWVNLPARDKMVPAHYQEIPKERLPSARTDDALASVRVIAGEALGARAVIETRTPILLFDWTLEPGASVDVPVPRDFDVYAYVFEGGATVGEGTRLDEGQLAILGGGDAVRLARPRESGSAGRLLLLGGVPLHEPVARYGPFVMNSEAEVRQAIADFRRGAF
ncbi:MAG TPA: pirin-like C-terminal cupin domain-containing protein, partial [Polyangiaceae bacterium]|nr:pirin-like C-terminal cupin domain-containing protein [Polyangiaceae bacterium]